MPRTIIDLPDDQLREIDRVCRVLKLSRAEAVRRGVAAFLQQNQTVEQNGYGLWRDARTQAKGLAERIRSKW
jgi:metal-responsive CopG/Arc/MetJ family transcriptional regulator